MKTNTLLLLFISLFFFNSCELINPDEEVPAYIVIDEIEFDGIITDSHNITEVWVFDGGTMLGAFDIPAMIPILKSGSVELTFMAGIKNNGVSGTRIIYPFMERDTEVLHLVQGEKTSHIPSFSYIEEVEIPTESIGQFNVAGFYGETTNSIANIIVGNIEEHKFEGKYGYVHLDEDENYWQGKSLGNMDLPFNEYAFLEFNYKCTNAFAAGLIANGSGVSTDNIKVVLNPTTDEFGIPQWKKVYIDIGDLITRNTFASSFNVLFEAYLQSNLNDGEIWLDNIYVVHFE